MGSFMYPRTISIKRAKITNTPADGLTQDEEVVAKSVACSIQLKRPRAGAAQAFIGPTSSNDAMPMWMCYIPLKLLALGKVHKGDQITDDQGDQYVVEAPYWNSLGYGLEMKPYHP